jgi:pimeloyl-ACP methyl ester carboxylesterase
VTADTIALPREAPRTIPGVSTGTRRLLRAFYDVVTRASPAVAAQFAEALFTTPVRQTLSPAARTILHEAFPSVLDVNGRRLRLFCWPGAAVRALALLSMPPDVSYMLRQFKLVMNLRPDVQQLLDRALVARFGGAIDRHVPEQHAHPVGLPVLLLHDSDDDVAPVAHANALAHQLPSAQLTLTCGLNHCGLLTHAPAIEAVTAFMTKTLECSPEREAMSGSVHPPPRQRCRAEMFAQS